MILTLVGTHHQPFDRLLRAVDEMPVDEPRICQTGHSCYKPNGECRDFFSYDETMRLLQSARVVICHAGTGTVMSALSAGKCPVVAPRLARYGEHVDNHQLELVNGLAALGLIVPYMPGDDLAQKVEEAALRNGQRAISPAPELVARLHHLVAASAAGRK